MKLSPIKSAKPLRFAVCDIETMNWTKFLVLGFYDGTSFRTFLRIRDFFAFLRDDADGPQTIFAHFGGKFDFLFILESALKHRIGKVSGIIPRGSSILTFDLELGDRKITFRDSAALLPFSLKSITENFGVETKKGDWDHSKTTGVTEGLIEYLKSDCIGLHQSLTAFYDWPLIKKAGPAATVAGQAMRVFRTMIQEEQWALSNTVSDFVRKGYFGGRTEIFKPIFEGRNERKLFEYDVNSLYPYVMLKNEFPAGRAVRTFELKKGKLGVYEAQVKAPDDIYLPVLGIIHDKKFIFPKGKFKGVWTSSELDRARELGYEIEITSGYYWTEKEKLFERYVSELYAIRKHSPKKSVSDIVSKLLMNSLYGRFGMNLDKENITLELKAGVTPYKLIECGSESVQLFKEKARLKSYSNVAIACFTTSYARLHLFEILKSAGQSIYYCDTDSVFTTERLETSEALGGLKLECEYDSAVFLLPKTYSLDGQLRKIAMKGFDRKKIQAFSHDDFKNYFEGELGKMRIEIEPKFAALKSAVAQKKLVTMTKASHKELKGKYDKRILTRTAQGGFDTEPISIGKENEDADTDERARSDRIQARRARGLQPSDTRRGKVRIRESEFPRGI